MKYASPEAFRAALDQRLKNAASKSGASLGRLRKTIAFERFLARLVIAAPDRWVLKGALALDFRLGGITRTTKDIDLGRIDDEHAATEDFVSAQALDLGDFFSFDVRRTAALDAAQEFSAVRYTVRAELAGRTYETFPVDVGFSDPLPWSPDRIRPTQPLAFAGIAPTEIPVLPIEQHVAEKLHAYTRSYGTDATASTRPKDLIDIVLIKRSTRLDAAALHTALVATFTTRDLQPLPNSLSAPPRAWARPYQMLAEAVGLPTDLDEGHREAEALLGPILASRLHASWDPATQRWITGAGTVNSEAQLTPPAPEAIVISELQNFGTDIQPIRARTISMPLTNAGDSAATIATIDAQSPTRGPLTARSPRIIAAGESAMLQLTLAAAVDQNISPGTRINVVVRYRASDHAQDRTLAYSAEFAGPRWAVDVHQNDSP